MSLLRIGLAIVPFVCFCTLTCAQEPTDLPALPGPMPVRAEPMLSQPDVSPIHCTPGHCRHRGLISRRRCKRHLQQAFLGFPEEFERAELGAMMYSMNRVQVSNAAAASLIFYHYDFEPGTSRLNLRGRDKLASIAAKLPTTFAPVIIERTGVPSFDEQRRLTVLEGLGTNSFPIPSERVVVGPAISRGLRGDEAVLIHENLLTRTSQSGPPVSVGFDSPGSGGSSGGR